MQRIKKGKAFSYVTARGKTVKDPKTLKRVASLVIPPAWNDVWICPHPEGHIQATGIDAKGRKQYRYHPRWNQARDMAKYYRMVPFARSLPKIRARVEKDLALDGLPREKVLAAVVRLLEETLIRVGNEEYVKQNKSFGLTTLRRSHVMIHGDHIRFHFKGKSGKQHDIDLVDSQLAPIVRLCKRLPEEEVFEYIDENGTRHDVASDDINSYLREVSGQVFTAKDFRTWSGTVHAALALSECVPCTSTAEAKRNVVQAIARVAEKLGNTPAVCKKSYVHPLILASYLEKSLPIFRSKRSQKTSAGLSLGERAVLRFLEECLTGKRASAK